MPCIHGARLSTTRRHPARRTLRGLRGPRAGQGPAFTPPSRRCPASVHRRVIRLGTDDVIDGRRCCRDHIATRPVTSTRGPPPPRPPGPRLEQPHAPDRGAGPPVARPRGTHLAPQEQQPVRVQRHPERPLRPRCQPCAPAARPTRSPHTTPAHKRAGLPPPAAGARAALARHLCAGRADLRHPLPRDPGLQSRAAAATRRP